MEDPADHLVVIWLSSTRGTPLGLLGKSGFKRENCASVSQQW
jgi:hypothetical protein